MEILTNNNFILALLLTVLILLILNVIFIYLLLSLKQKIENIGARVNNITQTFDINRIKPGDNELKRAFELQNETLSKMIDQKLNKIFQEMSLKNTMNRAEVQNLKGSNTDLNKTTQEKEEFVYVSHNNNRLVKTSSEKYFKIKKDKGRYLLLVSENILSKSPTPEYDSIIEQFYKLNRKQNLTRYKLVYPTELKYYNESTGEFEIKSKGVIEYA